MLPRWHIFWGAIFSLFIWEFVGEIKYEYTLLIFLSSIFIDLDHYINAVIKNKNLHLGRAFDYHKDMAKIQEGERKKGIRKKGDFHLFHTIEFHLFIALIGIFWTPFFYIFIGMVFHSFLDFFYLINKDYLYRREYFFFKWISDKI